MYLDVRLKAVKGFLGVAFLVTAFIMTVQGDTKSGSKSKGSSNSQTASFLGPDAVILTASDLTKNKVSPTKGNNGVGNGIDPAPPGNPRENDGPGTSPGNPGNKGGKANP